MRDPARRRAADERADDAVTLSATRPASQIAAMAAASRLGRLVFAAASARMRRRCERRFATGWRSSRAARRGSQRAHEPLISADDRPPRCA